MSKEEKNSQAQEQDDARKATDPESVEVTEGPAEGQGGVAEPEELHLLLEDARAKADEHYEQLVRARAELENLRKRTDRDLENAHRYALEKFVNELLPVRDSMEMGLEAATEQGADPAKLHEGMELTLKMLTSAMEKFGVEEVDPAGEKFNPELHQAMSMQEAPEKAPNTVLTVVQKGYRLNDRLVRPAMVIVSSGGQQSQAGEYEASGDRTGGQLDEEA